MTELKQLRTEKEFTQQQVANMVGISLRSYKSYENDEEKKGTIKYKYIVDQLAKINPVDENHGVVSIDYIKEKCASVFKKYDVNYCYLFGSYAKGYANEKSDIDLLISADVTGLKYYGLVEELRSSINKRIDLLDVN